MREQHKEDWRRRKEKFDKENEDKLLPGIKAKYGPKEEQNVANKIEQKK